jgi:hypothetical protein
MAVPTIVPVPPQKRAPRDNMGQNIDRWKLLRTEEFRPKNADGRVAEGRLANRRLQPLGHLTAVCKYTTDRYLREWALVAALTAEPMMGTVLGTAAGEWAMSRATGHSAVGRHGARRGRPGVQRVSCAEDG